jgi:Putative peptidoglycan binding domain/L,D-transpeptidase catalytic domain
MGVSCGPDHTGTSSSARRPTSEAGGLVPAQDSIGAGRGTLPEGRGATDGRGSDGRGSDGRGSDGRGATHGSGDRGATRASAHGSRRSHRADTLRLGASGDDVRDLQRRLRALGYWLGAGDGTYGVLTQQAVLAFQGVEGLQRDGVAGPQTYRALATAERPEPRSGTGDLIEIDEAHGVLLIVRGGRVKWAIHASSGSNDGYVSPSGETKVAETPNGRWTLSWAFDGWHKSPLGRLWRPRYFHPDGIAIHGFASVPPYPASHGCVRVSIEAMNYMWDNNLAPLGSTVWVY